jgi:hypothetical protein
MNMAKGTVEKRALTQEELADAGRLRAAWETYKNNGKGRTQVLLASETGLGKQSLIGQYMNGIIPLNPKAVLAFARVMNVRPAAISPSMNFPTGDKVDQTLTADAMIEIMLLYRQASAPARARIANYMRSAEKSPDGLKSVLSSDEF